MRQFRWLWLSTIIFGADQLTKWLTVSHFTLHEQLPVTPFFSLTLAFNKGAALSFLGDASGWQRWFLSGIAIIVSSLLLSWLKKLNPKDKWQACALACILGGALGNLYDRIIHGQVTDFLLFYYDRWYFPAFNVADVAISIGAGLLVLDAFFNENSKAPKNI